MAAISAIHRFIRSTSAINHGIYQITNMGANVVLIVERELTLIDTGFRGSSSSVIDFVRHLGRSPEEINLIILTHNHIDHVGGLHELKRQTPAKVAIHRADIGERKNQPSARLEDVDIKLEGGEILRPLGGLEVVHTPGHTPGSISLYSAQHKLLFIGDALRKRRLKLLLPPKPVSFDLRQALESARKISQLDFDTLCFGHGLPLSGVGKSRILDLLERNRD